MHRLPPQVEKPVFEPCLLRIFGLTEHRQRQLLGLAEHVEIADEHLDFAGSKLVVHQVDIPKPNFAVHPDDGFGTELTHPCENVAVRVGKHLGHPVVVAQVDEEHTSMVADSMHPAGEPYLCSDILPSEFGAIVGPVLVHVLVSLRPVAGCRLSLPSSGMSRIRTRPRAAAPIPPNDCWRNSGKGREPERGITAPPGLLSPE